MKKKKQDTRLWFLQELGLEVGNDKKIEWLCDCPFNDDENHMYLNSRSLLYNCKICNESGNYTQLMGQLAINLAEDIGKDELKELAKGRQLPVAAFKGYDIGYTGDYYTLPVRDVHGKINNVLRYRPGGKLLGAPGCKMGLFGAQHLTDDSRKTEPVYIVEGPWDLAALEWLRRKAQRRGVVIAVLGAGHLPAEAVDLFVGRDVFVVQDNDEPGNKGEARIAGILSKVVKSISFFRWRKNEATGKDIRDIVIAAAKKKTGDALRKQWATIHSRFVDKPLLPIPEDIKPPTMPSYDDPHLLAGEVLEAHYMHKNTMALRYYRGAWYHWYDSCYCLLPTKELRAKTNKQLRQVLDGMGSGQKVVRQTVDNVLQATEGLCLVEGHVEMPIWLSDSPSPAKGDLLAMENGLLDLEAVLSGEDVDLLSPSPNWFCTSYWPYKYDQEKKCHRWIRFLKQVLPKLKERKLLQEFLGYCLTFDTSYHKSLILVGDGANGKSVVTEVATQLIGPSNVSHVGLERFGDKFALAPTVGRLANIVSEVSKTKGVAEDTLKAMISGDLIRGERKYHDPVDARPTVRLIFATNEVPHFSDRSEGLWRRLLFLPFNVTIPEAEQDRKLAKRICQKELPGIFNWAIRGLRRLRENGGFTAPLSSKRLLKQQKSASNPAREYLLTACEVDANVTVTCNTVYTQYTQWCYEQKLAPLTKQQFGQEVYRVFPSVKRKQLRKGEHRNRHYHYVGLKHKIRLPRLQRL